MAFTSTIRTILVIALVLAGAVFADAQGLKRIVMVKIDGLPGYLVDKYVHETDPATGKSQLPWIEEVFYKNGTRLDNFYTRGMSLSGPSWSSIDTGQRLHIKGNVEYDRYTLHSYDYLNFVPFYIDAGLTKLADMPAVEVLDQLGVPLFYDIFPFKKRYVSPQLYQRGVRWALIGSGFMNLYPGNPGDMIDEWAMGIHFSSMTVMQSERDIVGRLRDMPEFDYLDFYDTSFDHIAHGNNDPRAQLADIKKLDRTIGRFWTAIRDSSRADETAIVLISDHGFNSAPKIYSQGFNLVKLLNKRAAGAHHVVTKRQLMLDYEVKAPFPFQPVIGSLSDESLYLKGKGKLYPTALFDFDGNERSSVQLRNSDLNLLHILFLQLQKKRLDDAVRRAAMKKFFEVIDANRPSWQRTIAEIEEEMDALHRHAADEDAAVGKMMTQLPTEKGTGETIAVRRRAQLSKIAAREEAEYRAYIATLRDLLALDRGTFVPHKLKVETLIAPGAMGDHNSIYQLQNYIAGPSTDGLRLDSNGDLDMDRSFARVDYFNLLASQRVLNTVQRGVGNRPVDFLATRIQREAFGDRLAGDLRPDSDPIWLCAARDKQALLLTRRDGSIRYVPIRGLTGSVDGGVSFEPAEWSAGLPLNIIEDPELQVPVADKAAWLSEWHTEVEWMRAIHRTKYSNGIIGLIEQLGNHPLFDEEPGLTADEQLIRRFRVRQRLLAEADLLIMANDHWNFDVKGFNPGGNHGSFFRTSTNSTFMLAGGGGTGIPRGVRVIEPYDNLSVLPTILALMGRIDEDNLPDEGLRSMGFRRFPGRVVTEVTGPRASTR